jgi:endo-1,4-beta-xylanase
MSWKNGYPIPGRRNYALLFDRNRQPKPAFDAVLRIPRDPRR